jgi:hypothetical protein
MSWRIIPRCFLAVMSAACVAPQSFPISGGDAVAMDEADRQSPGASDSAGTSGTDAGPLLDLPPAARPDAPVPQNDTGPPSPVAGAESGAVIWRTGTGNSGQGLAVDRTGNIILGGTRLTDDMDLDLQLAEYSPDGQLIWEKTVGGPSGQAMGGLALAADGTVGVIGDFNGPTDFGGQQRTNQGIDDIFFALYSPDGDLRSVTTFGGSGVDQGGKIAADASGDWFISGYASGLIIAGRMLQSEFVARLDGTGMARWSTPKGGAAVLPFGNAVYAGGADTPQLLRYGASDGVVAWSNTLSATASIFNVSVRAIAVDRIGQRLIITGSFRGSMSLAGRTVTSYGQADVFVAGIEAATGQMLWGEVPLGSQGEDQGNSACTDENGNAYVTGTYRGSDSPAFGEPQIGVWPFVAKYRADGTREWLKIISVSGNGMSIVCDSPRGILVGLDYWLARLVP